MRKQIESCAARMPEPQRSAFLAEMDRAAALQKQAGEIASQAWAAYRSVTGRPKYREERKP
jgi:hypothetical protein